MDIVLYTEHDTKKFATQFARAIESNPAELEKGFIVYLLGDLGTGKSCLSRHFIQYFLPKQKVKSPTYNLIETYDVCLESTQQKDKSKGKFKFKIHHFDLYRIANEEELDYLALKDILVNKYISFIEWPQNGSNLLPKPYLSIELTPHILAEDIGRKAVIKSHNKNGERIIKYILND